MKEEKSFRAFTSSNETLWETLNNLNIPVTTAINPAFLHCNSTLTPENIIIIIGRAPPSETPSTRQEADLTHPRNASARDIN